MRHQLVLTYDQIDEIILADLKAIVADIEDEEVKNGTLDAFLRVLEYYMTGAQFTEYLKENNLSYTGTPLITSVRENSDGSANITLENLTPQQTEYLISQGVNHVMIKAITNLTTDEILHRLAGSYTS